MAQAQAEIEAAERKRAREELRAAVILAAAAGAIIERSVER